MTIITPVLKLQKLKIRPLHKVNSWRVAELGFKTSGFAQGGREAKGGDEPASPIFDSPSSTLPTSNRKQQSLCLL